MMTKRSMPLPGAFGHGGLNVEAVVKAVEKRANLGDEEVALFTNILQTLKGEYRGESLEQIVRETATYLQEACKNGYPLSRYMLLDLRTIAEQPGSGFVLAETAGAFASMANSKLCAPELIIETMDKIAKLAQFEGADGKRPTVAGYAARMSAALAEKTPERLISFAGDLDAAIRFGGKLDNPSAFLMKFIGSFEEDIRTMQRRGKAAVWNGPYRLSMDIERVITTEVYEYFGEESDTYWQDNALGLRSLLESVQERLQPSEIADVAETAMRTIREVFHENQAAIQEAAGSMKAILDNSGKMGLLAVAGFINAFEKRHWHSEAANGVLGKFAAISKDFAGGLEENDAGKLIKTMASYMEQGAATGKFELNHVGELLDDLTEFRNFHGSMAASSGLYAIYAEIFVETKTGTKMLRC